MAKPSIVLVCTGNCCRSQMAEGLMDRLAGDRLEVHSAGSHPAGYVHPLAISVMAEIGIDIQGQWSKGLDELAGRGFDYVVTVCDYARDACPNLSGRKATHHWSLEDPAMMVWDEEAANEAARRVRDELKERLIGLLREIGIEPHVLGDAVEDETPKRQNAETPKCRNGKTPKR